MSVYLLANEQETKQFAEKIAQYCPKNEQLVIFLNGELAAGKTTFTRFFIQALGYHGIVKSPTYTIVEAYQLPKYRILHIDLYRLRFSTEVLEIGLCDELDQASIFLIEWPERATSFLPAPDIVCTFTMLVAHRQVALESYSASGQKLLQLCCFGSWFPS